MGDPGGVDWPKHAARLADQLLKANARAKELEDAMREIRAIEAAAHQLRAYLDTWATLASIRRVAQRVLAGGG